MSKRKLTQLEKHLVKELKQICKFATEWPSSIAFEVMYMTAVHAIETTEDYVKYGKLED